MSGRTEINNSRQIGRYIHDLGMRTGTNKIETQYRYKNQNEKRTCARSNQAIIKTINIPNKPAIKTCFLTE
jgi:hypothetical protein